MLYVNANTAIPVIINNMLTCYFGRIECRIASIFWRCSVISWAFAKATASKWLDNASRLRIVFSMGSRNLTDKQKHRLPAWQHGTRNKLTTSGFYPPRSPGSISRLSYSLSLLSPPIEVGPIGVARILSGVHLFRQKSWRPFYSRHHRKTV